MEKVLITSVIGLAMTFFAVAGDISVVAIAARQRLTANGLVDVFVTVSGASNDVAQTDLAFTATNVLTATELSVTHIVSLGITGSEPENKWNYRFIWNAGADLGEVKIEDVELVVEAKRGVQLWENGPYWSECNLGADRQEGYGYYFWWGDVIGYNPQGVTGSASSSSYSVDHWVSSTGAVVKNPSTLCSTQGFVTDLQKRGCVDSSGNLAIAYDAAAAHLGTPWRMPTIAEITALADTEKCTTRWTTRNNVYGRLVSGRGKYSSKSIFLPAAGYGSNSSLCDCRSRGYYWSSTPYTYDHYQAQHVTVSADSLCGAFTYRESCFPVRAIRNCDTGAISNGVMGTHLAVDFRTTQTTDIPIPYAWLEEQFQTNAEQFIEYERLACGSAANGLCVSNCYVAGLNVYDSDSQFRAYIEMVDGEIRLSWSPNLNADVVTRIYKIFGMQEIGDDDSWQTPIKPWHRFFRVAVSMKHDTEDEETAVSGEGFVPQE